MHFNDDLVGDSQLRKELGGVSAMTLSRWREKGVLPKPVKICGRNFTKRGPVERLKREGDGSSRPRSNLPKTQA